MALATEIDKIRANPGEYLTEACVLALGAFLFGYRVTNTGHTALLDELTRSFEGPDQADACTRAYLGAATTERALRNVLDVLDVLLAAAPEAECQSGINPQHGFVSFVRDAIMSGRTGLVFAEPTVDWCANYWKGFLAGIAEVDATAAVREREQFEAFERWLAARYDQAQVPWYALIRVYEGADLSGLRAFVSLWDEFQNQSSSQTAT